uniref:Secreted protein n=1 Tax=Oryza meridionalis TaxID=40149 RepID=A0A0E0DUX6_9ORYZ
MAQWQLLLLSSLQWLHSLTSSQDQFDQEPSFFHEPVKCQYHDKSCQREMATVRSVPLHECTWTRGNNMLRLVQTGRVSVMSSALQAQPKRPLQTGEVQRTIPVIVLAFSHVFTTEYD